MSILTDAVRLDKEYGELQNTALLDFKIPKPLPIAVGGLCDGASDAVLVSLIEDIRRERGGTALVICHSDKECARTAELLRRFGIAASVFGTRDLNLYNITASHDYEHERLRVLFGITHGTLDAVVATPDAALGYTVPRDRLQKTCFRLDFDTPVDLASYARRLCEAGYVRVDMVDGMGQFAIRGGILDVFPPVFEAIGEECRFVQQYDPFTMQPSLISLEGEQDAYGPAMLSVMEYTARMYGIHIEREEIYWGTCSGAECTYEQQWGDNLYRLVNSNRGAEGYVNGKLMFTAPKDKKIITDISGNLLRTISFV
jgi:hypothetical protein